ncbi:MAG: sodium:proton antiporter [Caldisericia bacterium]|nr:NADH-quinone oxidoreductase subunit K [Caldisericia bacterium]MDD5689987.1 sodium:proton antiporter [Caldisericia bacterium]HOJ15812.1 sodium:proton antiporter [Caldisericia bacterium]HOW02509.1 sodium:proton antiporter [Caldisericia bacterium]HXK70080.1 sodium:proton antiporter [Caldisericia bacterium]
MIYSLCLVLFILGLYCVLTKKNLIKIIVGLVIMDNAVNLFFVLLGYRTNGTVPIITNDAEKSMIMQHSVDPIPQALVLTSIVISLGILALMVSLAIRLYEKYGTFDITKIRKLKG